MTKTSYSICYHMTMIAACIISLECIYDIMSCRMISYVYEIICNIYISKTSYTQSCGVNLMLYTDIWYHMFLPYIYDITCSCRASQAGIVREAVREAQRPLYWCNQNVKVPWEVAWPKMKAGTWTTMITMESFEIVQTLSQIATQGSTGNPVSFSCLASDKATNDYLTNS